MMKRMKVYAFLGALVFPSYLLAAVTVPDSTSRKSVMLDEVVVTSYKEKRLYVKFRLPYLQFLWAI